MVVFLFFLGPALTARNEITPEWQPAAWSENSHLSHSAASCRVRYAKLPFRKFQHCQILLAANVFHSITLEGGKKTLGKIFELLLLLIWKKIKNKKGSKKRHFINDEINLPVLAVILVGNKSS